jgi:hypothetical protein
MSEGCNLPTSKEDYNQIQSSLERGLTTDQGKVASSLLRNVQKDNPTELMSSLKDPKNVNYQIVNKALVKSFGEKKVFQEEEAKLNRALYSILKDHPDPQGLFEKPPKHRGPGSTSVDHPYEVLCAAALVQKEFKSSNGHTLKIYNTDRLDLGQKSASNQVLSTVKKNTIESDILIQRSRGPFNGFDIIGIDAKYTKDSTYNKLSDRQLDGVKSSLLNGELSEFHFVTNAHFTEKFKERIDTANREIIIEAMYRNKDIYAGISEITNTERQSIDAIALAAKLDFKNDREQINSLLNDRVGQIGYSEKVNFE